MVSWRSRKQSSVELSTAEAYYITWSVAVHKVVWLRKLLTYLLDHEMDPTTTHCDNQSCLNLSENPMFHDRSKQIEIKYHYIRDMVHVTPCFPQFVNITILAKRLWKTQYV
jgi:hypothetical protein